MAAMKLPFKRIVKTTLLILASLSVYSQTTEPYPFNSDIIKFDVSTGKTDKTVPFDRPFILSIENVNNENIVNIFLYRVKYQQGNRILYPDEKSGDSYADYVFSPKEIILEKNKITLLLPALKPGKDFDILIEKKISGRNVEKALALHKLIKENNYVPAPGVPWTAAIGTSFKTLRDSANNSQFYPPRDVFIITDPDDYYNQIYSKTKGEYDALTDDTKLTQSGALSFFSAAEIKDIVDNGPSLARTFIHGYLLEHVNKEGSFDNLLLGLIHPSASHKAKLADRFEFDKRISNLQASINFFDTLYLSLNELAASSLSAQGVRDQSLKILEALQSNKKVLADNLKAATDEINKFNEAIWLIGTTDSKDLQTKSSSVFTVDAGMANIWARNLDNKVVYIPKLYWGLNIYFRGVDKNLASRYFKKKKKPETINAIKRDYDLLSHKTILNKLCLSIGFTIGSLDKANFDHFFANSTMLIGPSYRITRSFRMSGGIVFLKRTSLNPLKADKEITQGAYVSVSLDLDILNAAKTVSNLFFK